MKDIKDSKRYHKIKNRCFYIELFIDAVFLVFFQLSGFSVALREFASGHSSSFWIINGIYVVIFSLIFYVLHFPMRFFLVAAVDLWKARAQRRLHARHIGHVLASARRQRA